MVKPFLDHDGPIAFAHRGGALEAPENTMAAFSYAVELGYSYIETDVHVTADGVLLAFHDDVLDRVTDAAGVIAELPYREVQAARIDGEHEIPLFTDLLEAFPDVRINVDTKSDASVAALAETIVATGCIDRICVGSFEDHRIQQLRAQLGSGLCTAAGPAEVRRLRVASFVPPTLAFKADCLQVPVFHGRHRLVDQRFVRAAHRRNLVVHVWTIDDAEEMDELLDLEVDGIMTDRPAALARVMAERGGWPGPPPPTEPTSP
jgi:glycerophosphoryl diester phosphodiesterase